MTNQQIVDRYLSSIGRKLVSGTGTLEPILPFIQMDVAYNMWLKDIMPIKCKFDMKKIKNAWVHQYGLFNRAFFRVFTQEEQYEVIDRMDEFESYIGNDIMIAKVQVMNYLTDLDTDQAMICSSLIVINILCQAAQVVWKAVYKTDRFHECTNNYIESMEKLSYKFMNAYHEQFCHKYVNPNESKAIEDAVNVLCKRMINWLYQSRDNEKESIAG